MKIPNSNKKKALVIIDVQPAFVNESNKFVVRKIRKLINKMNYKLYIETIFHAEKGTIWESQIKWTLPKDKKMHTVKELASLLKENNALLVKKTTRSIFKGNKNILKILKANKIREIHIVGLLTNSCVITTALESFDYGFFTYVIEECCSGESKKEHKAALTVLRGQNLTNNSCVEKIRFMKI